MQSLMTPAFVFSIILGEGTKTVLWFMQSSGGSSAWCQLVVSSLVCRRFCSRLLLLLIVAVALFMDIVSQLERKNMDCSRRAVACY